MEIRAKIKFEVDQKQGTQQNKKLEVGESSIIGVNKTNSYTALRVEITGANFTTADLNTFKATCDDPNIEKVLVDQVAIVSDKKIRTTIQIYPKLKKNCCIFVFALALIVPSAIHYLNKIL